MRKEKDSYFKEFNVNDILLSKFEDEVLKSECWKFSLILESDDYVSLEAFSINGMSVNAWIHSLFGQKMLYREGDEPISRIKNSISVLNFDIGYILTIIEMILLPNLPENIRIHSISLNFE
jgi:hypothetical protein